MAICWPKLKLDPADTLDHTVKTTVDKVTGKEQLSLNF